MNYFSYSVGDLVADPISKIYGVITEVEERKYNTLYKILWHDDVMNGWHKKYWDHYEITRISKVKD
jgi:hypothetical protein